ncbi:TD and POZ domain-containing protein 4 [Araneus ventricosus]|uniref:TD and POZ domain-containing protein 4 n=1 Tax=Araneus ventricosus TaxID=182803 RepID=A0A4Y2IHD4_ARAVE|nr:TD and POZ domain-containing protein 4 [Araneus ventricosus]
MNNGRKEYTFFWFIENYSYCWHKNGEKLISPDFTVDKLGGTTWALNLYPRGDDDEDEGHISFFLTRSEQDDGPENISLNFQLSVLTADGSAICSPDFQYAFGRGNGYGEGEFLKTDEILLRRKSDYIPQDILTVCCKIWMGDGNVCRIGQSSARTCIRVAKNSFLHVVENFSKLQPNAKQTIMIQSHSKKRCFISSSLYFTEGLCCKEKIMMEIFPSNSNRILCKCEFFLLDGSGNIIKCGETDNRYDAARKDIHKLPLSLTREVILNRKSEYLPDDKLSLICECTFSSGIDFQLFDEILNEVPLAIMKLKRNYVPRKNDYKAVEKLSIHSSLLEDIKSLYTNQCLTDVEVKTKTKSFPAHKIVLCARSPVFKAMMTNDMKEKITDCIHVDDLENDIMQQLLFFLYSDNIENLQWNTATQLYYAADKYQIADTHSDNDFKKSVEDFILEREEQIFGSKEWDKLAETNPLLCLRTMQLKYKREKMN